APDDTVPPLPSTLVPTAITLAQCVATLAASTPYAPPDPQVPPTQEAGTARRPGGLCLVAQKPAGGIAGPLTHGSNASQALRTRSIRRTNRGSPRRFARNGSYSESHGKLMKPNSTARSQQSIAASRSFTSAKQPPSHQEKIS